MVCNIPLSVGGRGANQVVVVRRRCCRSLTHNLFIYRARDRTRERAAGARRGSNEGSCWLACSRDGDGGRDARRRQPQMGVRSRERNTSQAAQWTSSYSPSAGRAANRLPPSPTLALHVSEEPPASLRLRARSSWVMWLYHASRQAGRRAGSSVWTAINTAPVLGFPVKPRRRPKQSK